MNKTEKDTVAAMIRIYCKAHHHQKELCDSCNELKNYALKRIDYCVFKENKPNCNSCAVHCYSEKNKDNIKQVMRYSGKHMMYKHPYLTLLHFLKKKKKS